MAKDLLQQPTEEEYEVSERKQKEIENIIADEVSDQQPDQIVDDQLE